MSKVRLKYVFIFDPENVWFSNQQFDEDLAKYFTSKGFIAEKVRDPTERADEIVVFLKREEGLAERTNPPVPPQPQSTKKVFADLKQRRGFGGEFKKTNG